MPDPCAASTPLAAAIQPRAKQSPISLAELLRRFHVGYLLAKNRALNTIVHKVLDAVTNDFVSTLEIRTVRRPRPHPRRLMAGAPAAWSLLIGEGSLGKAALI
jgi:hypothetical protein